MEGYEIGYILGFHRKYEFQPGESIWERGIIFKGNVQESTVSRVDRCWTTDEEQEKNWGKV